VTLRADRADVSGEREIRIRLTFYKEQKYLSTGFPTEEIGITKPGGLFLHRRR
jgi:hypothetical protein